MDQAPLETWSFFKYPYSTIQLFLIINIFKVLKFVMLFNCNGV